MGGAHSGGTVLGGSEQVVTAFGGSEIIGGLYESASVSGGAVTGGAARKRALSPKKQVEGLLNVKNIQSYGNSIYTEGKENMIRAIAKDIFSVVGANGISNVDNADIDTVVKQLVKAIPTGKGGKRVKFNDEFNNSNNKQASVCRRLATAINKHCGQVINTDMSESAMCDKISEVILSLVTGLHTEFMTVAGDVLRVMNNMQIAQDYLTSAYNRQKELIASSNDDTLKSQSEETDAVYNEIMTEYNRQRTILSNLINVTIGPSGKLLISSLEDNEDFSGTVKNLKAMVGTKAFGDKLSYLLSGVSSVAHSADIICKALKQIGFAVKDFVESKNPGDLQSKLYQFVVKSNPSSGKLDQMMKAIKIIQDADYNHEDIVRLLRSGKSVKGGGVSDNDSDGEHAEGGGMHDELLNSFGDDDNMADTEKYANRVFESKRLDKKIKSKDKQRALLLSEFKKQLNMLIRKVVETANGISRKIGNEIPVTDSLKHFVNKFRNLPELDKERFHEVLSGYYKDAKSRSRREDFLTKYEVAINSCENLVKGSNGSLFSALASSLSSVVKAVDNFSDKIVKAITEIHLDRPGDVESKLRETASRFYGGSDSGEDLFGSGTWKDLKTVANEMFYYMSIANVKINLARSNQDMREYTSDYEQILGEESAWLIDTVKTQFMARINLDHTKQPPVGTPASVLSTWDELSKMTLDDGKNALDSLRTLWTFQMNAKINMIKAAQAVDLYLKSFTNGMSKNPDSIGSIVKMLSEVEHVAKWFTEKSGDNLSAIFDVFPCELNTANVDFLDTKDKPVNNTGIIKIPAAGSHYYAYLTTQHTSGKRPGNPFIGRPLKKSSTDKSQCKGILMLSKKVIKTMRALENILSAFSTVGAKFGDVTPAADTFMTPGQIFNALCDYVAASAFTNEFATGYKSNVGAYMMDDDKTILPANVPQSIDGKTVKYYIQTLAITNNGDGVIPSSLQYKKPNKFSRLNNVYDPTITDRDALLKDIREALVPTEFERQFNAQFITEFADKLKNLGLTEQDLMDFKKLGTEIQRVDTARATLENAYNAYLAVQAKNNSKYDSYEKRIDDLEQAKKDFDTKLSALDDKINAEVLKLVTSISTETAKTLLMFQSLTAAGKKSEQEISQLISDLNEDVSKKLKALLVFINSTQAHTISFTNTAKQEEITNYTAEILSWKLDTPTDTNNAISTIDHAVLNNIIIINPAFVPSLNPFNNDDEVKVSLIKKLQSQLILNDVQTLCQKLAAAAKSSTYDDAEKDMKVALQKAADAAKKAADDALKKSLLAECAVADKNKKTTMSEIDTLTKAVNAYIPVKPDTNAKIDVIKQSLTRIKPAVKGLRIDLIKSTINTTKDINNEGIPAKIQKANDAIDAERVKLDGAKSAFTQIVTDDSDGSDADAAKKAKEEADKKAKDEADKKAKDEADAAKNTPKDATIQDFVTFNEIKVIELNFTDNGVIWENSPSKKLVVKVIAVYGDDTTKDITDPNLLNCDDKGNVSYNGKECTIAFKNGGGTVMCNAIKINGSNVSLIREEGRNAMGGALKFNSAISGTGIKVGTVTDNKYTSLALSGLPSAGYGCTVSEYHSWDNAGKDDNNCQRILLSGWRDMFADTDMLYQMTVKSIVAKIFTAVDAFRLFHRPVSNSRAYYSLNPVRSILGGADVTGGADVPKARVIPEAVELYYRLVLLAEWYRDMFGVKSENATNYQGSTVDSWRVTIVPNLDGIWSELVTIIFDKVDYVKEGNYSDSQVRMLIKCMNTIWTTYKSKYPNSTTRHILNAFVLEMNKSFGFLRQSDIKTYIDKSYDIGTHDDGDDDDVTYDILDAENSYGSSRPAPSDKFSSVYGQRNKVDKKSTMVYLRDAINTLRKKIDAQFMNVLGKSPVNPAKFNDTIDEYKKSVSIAKSDSDAFKIIANMIQKADETVGASVEQLMMVFESIVVPKCILVAVQDTLDRFNNICHSYSLKNLSSFRSSLGISDNTAFGPAYRNYLKDKYRHEASYDPYFNNFYNGLDIFTSYTTNSEFKASDIKCNKLLKALLLSILSLTTNNSKLISCSISSNGSLNIDFSVISDLCIKLVEDVKSNCKKMSNMTNSVISEYIKTLITNSPDGILYIEENLVTRLLQNKYEMGLASSLIHARDTINRISKQGTDPNKVLSDSDCKFVDLHDVISELSYYNDNIKPIQVTSSFVNNSAFPGNLVALTKALETNDEKNSISKTQSGTPTNERLYNKLHQMPVILFKTPGNELDFAPGNGSLFFAFNNAVTQYIYTTTDENALKTYSPLYEQYVSGPGALEVTQRKGFPDVRGVVVGDTNGATVCIPGLDHSLDASKTLGGMPADGSVLTYSNATIIRSLLSTSVQTTTVTRRKFLYDNLLEMPDFVKERLKTNLPMFVKVFNTIAERADLLRSFVQNTNIKNKFEQIKTTNQGLTDPTMFNSDFVRGSLLRDLNSVSKEQLAQYHVSILSRLSESARSFRKSADMVYRELQDKPPVFFETSKDFLEDYAQRMNSRPFMPYSLIAAPVFGTDGDTLIPKNDNGSPEFKYKYATRALLNQNTTFSLDHFPGSKLLYNNYAQLTAKNVVITPNEFVSTVQNTCMLVRFMINGRQIKKVFDRSDALYDTKTLTNNILTASTSDLVDLVENITVASASQAVVDKLSVLNNAPANGSSSRVNLQIQNILDADIVPLNVHAFMREVPYTNLINYSYTFDRMIMDFLLPDYYDDKLNKPTSIKENTITFDQYKKATNVREMLAKLLIYPFVNCYKGETTNSEYFNFVRGLFNGDDDFRLGRPKYLSDQMWNKALLSTSEVAPDYGAKGVFRQYLLNNNKPYAPVVARRKGVIPNTTLIVGGEEPFYAELGKLRFDTKLSRNLVWFVQLQRILRIVLISHLSWINTPVVRGLKLIDPKITEYDNDDVYDDDDFNGKKYNLM
jgi:hypothetical protein